VNHTQPELILGHYFYEEINLVGFQLVTRLSLTYSENFNNSTFRTSLTSSVAW